MGFNQFDPLDLPIRPGLYINFIEAATARITGGERGTVAIPLKKSVGASKTDTFYEVSDEATANELFGASNIKSIKLALEGGANKVLVYTLPATPDMAVIRKKFNNKQFNVFVYDGVPTASENSDLQAWVKDRRENGQHFFGVIGGSATQDASGFDGLSRTDLSKDDYMINLVNGVVKEGVSYSSGEFAPFIAGLVASTPINQSLTFKELPVEDVTNPIQGSDFEHNLEAGSLLFSNDGDAVKIERGLTTGPSKIRKISARQQISTDIRRTARQDYIGKLNNNEDGQMALMNAIKAYLETLEDNNVLTDIDVKLDPNNKSIGDQVFLAISFTEIDSMEQIFLTINV